MLPEQEKLIYKNFADLVRDCDLERIIKRQSKCDSLFRKLVDTVKFEEDRRHNNRCILFKLLQLKSDNTIFDKLIKSLRDYRHYELADKLENKPSRSRPIHITCCFKLPDDDDTYENIPIDIVNTKQLEINVKHATQFCDNGDCYNIRSRNRGQVLIINNINFDSEHRTRHGAEVDGNNLKDLFKKIGFSVDIYKNLNKEEIEKIVEKFANTEYENKPDVCVVVIMSHGEKIDNKTVIIGTDGNGVEEDWIIQQFNNQTCVLFRNKPKILIFHICRGELVDNLAQYTQHTECDSACMKKPDIIDNDERFFSDLMICHPSVEGFQAHRDTVRGCWYIELICKVFMERSHEMDVESMLKLVEKGLKTRISEKRTRQTSTFLNIAFRTCYLNPGIYEEDGEIKHFNQCL